MDRKVSFEIRTAKGNRPVYAYDCVELARLEKPNHEERLGIPLKLIRVTRIEKELA